MWLPAAIVLTGRVTGASLDARASCPAPLSPQPQTDPSVPRSTANWTPTETPATDTGTPAIRSGVVWPACVPSPSSPSLLAPQVHTEVTAEVLLASVAAAESQ